MKKYYLVFDTEFDKQQMHEHMASVLHFPEYYGKNLDALYDCLSEICEDTCIGIYYDKHSKNYEYLKRIKNVFDDIEVENERVLVFYTELQDNNGFENYANLYRNRRREREDIYVRESQLRPVELRDTDGDTHRKKGER